MVVQNKTDIIDAKKTFIINVLGKLIMYWDKANKIIFAVKNKELDEETLDGIINMITIAIEKTRNDVRKSHMESALLELENIKSKEKATQDKEDKEAEEIIKSLDKLIEF